MSLAMSSRLWRMFRRDGIVIVCCMLSAVCCLLYVDLQYAICDMQRGYCGRGWGVGWKIFCRCKESAIYREGMNSI